MKILICGAGQVGRQLARQLSSPSEGNDVTVIDQNPALIANLIDDYDVRGVVGFASYPNVMQAAGAEDSDMVIAATQSDEVNMVVCQIAHSIFDITHKVARIRSKSYLDAIYGNLYGRDHLPVNITISPEQAVADAITRRLRAPAAFDSEAFMEGDVLMLGLRLNEDCPVVNTPLRQLTELFSTFVGSVAAIKRKGELFVPEPEDQMYVGDEIYLFCQSRELARSFEIFGLRHDRIDRVVIIGGGNIGLQIADMLEHARRNIRVKLIEFDKDRAQDVADKLDRTLVLNGDGLTKEILHEANIMAADAVIAITNDDKTNLLAAARAKGLGAKYGVALVNNDSLAGLARPLNLDIIFNPRTATVSSILKHLRHGRVKAVHAIGDNEAEVIEAEVLGTSPLDGELVSEIEWPEGSILGMVKRDGKIILPRGSLRLKENDQILIFALKEVVREIDKLLQVTFDFF